jgi:hypothetical protein
MELDRPPLEAYERDPSAAIGAVRPGLDANLLSLCGMARLEPSVGRVVGELEAEQRREAGSGNQFAPGRLIDHRAD